MKAYAKLKDGTKIEGELSDPSPEGCYINEIFYSWSDFASYRDDLSPKSFFARLLKKLFY